MTAFSDALRVVSVASLGVYVGAMLTEGFVLVRYWRGLPAAEFLDWYAANDRRLVGFFGPLTAAAAVLPLAAAAGSFRDGHPGRWAALVAAVLAVVLVSMFFVYFQQANTSFAAGTIRVEDVPAELGRWARWHWVRTGISIAAFAAALLALGCLG